MFKHFAEAEITDRQISARFRTPRIGRNRRLAEGDTLTLIDERGFHLSDGFLQESNLVIVNITLDITGAARNTQSTIRNWLRGLRCMRLLGRHLSFRINFSNLSIEVYYYCNLVTARAFRAESPSSETIFIVDSDIISYAGFSSHCFCCLILDCLEIIIGSR